MSALRCARLHQTSPTACPRLSGLQSSDSSGGWKECFSLYPPPILPSCALTGHTGFRCGTAPLPAGGGSQSDSLREPASYARPCSSPDGCVRSLPSLPGYQPVCQNNLPAPFHEPQTNLRATDKAGKSSLFQKANAFFSWCQPFYSPQSIFFTRKPVTCTWFSSRRRPKFPSHWPSFTA